MTIKQGNLYGMIFITLDSFLNSLSSVLIKHMRLDNVHHGVIFWSYKTIALVSVSLYLLCIHGRWRLFLHTNNITLHLSRAVLTTAGGLFVIYASKYINITDGLALSSAIQPIALIVIARIYFKEQINKNHLFGMAINLIGASIILCENSNIGINRYYMLVIFASCLWSANAIVVRLISKKEKVATQTFYMMLFSSLISPLSWMMSGDSTGHKLVGEFFQLWQGHMHVLLILSSAYILHVVLLFHAHKLARLASLAPLYYLCIVFTGFLQYFMLGISVSYVAVAGYLIIVLSSTLLMHREK